MRAPATAMVLAAGLGTRLRPLTDVRAKPAVPVAGLPLIRRILAWLAARGVTDAVVNLHHRPETITAVLGDGSDLGLTVRYSWEQPLLLGSAGGPRLALPILGVNRFWLVNGDTLADVDLAALAARHEAAGARVTMAVVPNREPEKYGGVRLNGDGHVIGFAPRGRGAAGTAHFIGVQLVDADVFRNLQPGTPAATIGGVYDALLATEPGSLAAYACDTPFHDIGTAADYVATSRDLRALDHDSPNGRRVRIDPSARVRETILWDDVSIGASAVVESCVVTDGVSVPPHAVYRHSVLVPDSSGLVRASPLAP